MARFSFRSGFDPFRGLMELQQELDRFVGKPSWGFDVGLSGRGVFPLVNVFADKEGVVVRAEVPGVEPGAIDISVEGRTLTISGERRRGEEENGSFHRRERSYGKFARSIALPDGLDRDRASAECKNGVLTVRIPKAEAARPKVLKVQAA
jgi:HSP20 family protein